MRALPLFCLALTLAPPSVAQQPTPVSLVEVARLMGGLAHDSLEGRMTGQPGIYKAARFLVAEMARIGLRPGGDSGFIQRVPLASRTLPNGRVRPVLMPTWADLDTVPADRRMWGGNVVGIIEGSDPALRGEYVLLTAHYDHVGIGAPAPTDSSDVIYNGADDDASGVVAILEMARLLKEGPAPKRTVVVAAVTGEEVGLLGTNWYIRNPPIPLDQMVANLNMEMIGRPDSLAGGPGKTWLTGYERSTLGDMLKAAGVPIIPDPRPQQNFFMRSDNIAFARLGIVAHTLSTFNLHTDYHRPSDEIETMDFAHMAQVITAAAHAARILADGPKAEWHPGGKPEPPAPRPTPPPGG